MCMTVLFVVYFVLVIYPVTLQMLLEWDVLGSNLFHILVVKICGMHLPI
jgi:hypothetical protein